MKKKLKNLSLTKSAVSKLTHKNSVYGGRDPRSISGYNFCHTNCPCSVLPACQ